MYFEADRVSQIPSHIRRRAEYIFVENNSFLIDYPHQKSTMFIKEGEVLGILTAVEDIESAVHDFEHDPIIGSIEARGSDQGIKDIYRDIAEILKTEGILGLDIISGGYSGYSFIIDFYESPDDDMSVVLDNTTLLITLAPEQEGGNVSVDTRGELADAIENFEEFDVVMHKDENEAIGEVLESLLGNEYDSYGLMVGDRDISFNFLVNYDENRMSGAHNVFDLSEESVVEYEYEGEAESKIVKRSVGSVEDFVASNPDKRVVVIRDTGLGETFNF